MISKNVRRSILKKCVARAINRSRGIPHLMPRHVLPRTILWNSQQLAGVITEPNTPMLGKE